MILMNDFRAEPEDIRLATLSAVERVLKSGWYVLGGEVKSFESQWSDICGTTHGVGVASGLDAIEIALRSLGIGPGDEVITTPMTAFATVLAIIRAGAQPVLADIDADTALSSLDSVIRCLSPSTKAVILVHLYGQLRHMNEWRQLCGNAGIHLIEDCAQAHLAAWKGRTAGSFGIAGCYSFYPTKNLGAVGDAGMLVTGDESIEQISRQLRNYGQSDRYHHPVLGMNSRLDEIQAAVLSERLRWLPEFVARRRAIAAAYDAGIANPRLTTLAPPEELESHSYHLYVINCEQRDELQAFLKERDIQTLIHYPVPAHWQQPCKEVARDPRGLEVSEAHARTCLSLPCHPQMTDAEVSHVIESVNEFRVG